MAEDEFATVSQLANTFQDRKVVELALGAKDRFCQQGDLDSAADAIRVTVSARCALLEDAIQVAKDGVSLCQPNARGRQLGTQRAEAKMWLAFAEAVEGMNLAECVSEAIVAAEKAHNYFASNGDDRLRVEVCAVLTQLRLSRGENKDMELAQKSAELAMEVSETMNVRCRGRALLARGAVAFPNWQPYAEKALELALDLEDLLLEVEVRLSMARWWAHVEEHESSLGQANEALDMLQEQGAGCHRQIAATQLACNALVELGAADQGGNRPQFAKALRLSQELLRLAEMEGSEVVRILASRHLIQTQIACSEARKAIETGKETLQWCLKRKPSRDYHCEAQILQTILQAPAQLPNGSQTEEIEHTCGLSLAMIQQLVCSDAGRSQAVELMIQVLKSFTLLGKPLEAWATASQLRELVRDSTSQAPLVVAMARSMQEAGRLEQSCELGQEAARLFEDQSDDRQAAFALSLVAHAQLKMGKFSVSRQNARRARRRFGEIGDCEEEIRMRMVVAKACSAKDERGNKQTKDALREAQEATKLAVEFGKHDLIAESLALYVEVLFEANQLETCCQAADELLRLEVPASFEHQISALFHAAKAQEKMANFLAAKTYAERVVQLAPKVAGNEPKAVVQQSRDMISGLRKKSLFDHSKAPLIALDHQDQQEERPRGGQDSGMGTKCPRCGYDGAEAGDPPILCKACKTHLPWRCRFCPDCGAKQKKDSSFAGPSSRGPAVKAGFFPLPDEHAPLKLRIQELTGKLLGIDSEDVQDDIPLKDIGLSSGAAVILRDELQNDVKGIRLPPTLFFDYPTVHAVVGYVTGKLR